VYLEPEERTTNPGPPKGNDRILIQRVAPESVLARHARLWREVLEIRKTIRNWRRVSIDAYLYKTLNLPDRDVTVRTRRGGSIRVPLRRNAGALYPVIDIIAARAYECDWKLEDQPLVIDIGAHVGSFLVWLGQMRPRLRGAAYEPDPAARQYLSFNLEANGLDRVEVFPEAVSARTGNAVLFRSVPGSGASSLRESSTVGATDSIVTPVVDFDQVVARQEGGIDLVKLDCEGSEYDIVLNSAETSWRRVKRVVMEYHPVYGRDPTSLVDRLHFLGFSTVKQRARTPVEGTVWMART
jgi:FkbM family methyltransferase